MSRAAFCAERPARILAIMPHPDDFEFNAGGVFAQLRAAHGPAVTLRIITTSMGASGHHQLGADETFHRRLQEARSSAALIEAEAECLTQLDGSHVQGQVLVTRNLLGGLWNAIRSYRADYLFCPPVAGSPLAAVHVDHEETARAIRLVGYQLGVPFAYPTLGQAAPVHYQAPAIFLTDDVYSAENRFHIAADIGQEFGRKTAMAECHVSQIFEWLPFNHGKEPPDREEFRRIFRERHSRINRRYGRPDDQPREYFRASDWGRRATKEDIDFLFPGGKILAPAFWERLSAQP